MQIYELTAVNEGILDTIKSGIQGAQRGYQGSKLDRQTQDMADKAYQSWRTYAAQLEKAIKDPAQKAAFDNRTDGLYQKSLAAWVQQNLMRNLPITGTTNQKEIIGLITQLSEPKVASATSTASTPTAATPTAATPTATTSTAATPTTAPTAAPTAAPATAQNPAGFNASNVMKLPGMPQAKTAPVAPAAKLPPPPAVKLPSWTTGTTGVVPNKVSLKETLSQSDEQKLFTQLVQQIAVAQYSADVRGPGTPLGGKQPVTPIQTVQAAQQLLTTQSKISPTQMAAIQAITKGMTVRSTDPKTQNVAQALGFTVS